MIHFIFIYSFSIQKKNEEIYVLNLSKFQEFNSPQTRLQEVLPTPKIKRNKKKPLKIEKPAKKEEAIKPVSKKENKTKDSLPIIKPEKKQKTVNNVEEIKKPIKIEKIKEEKLLKTESKTLSVPSNQNKNRLEVKNNKRVLVNKMLSDYLTFISVEINKAASRSYPIQSIKRREQGRIISVLSLDKSGNLLNIEVEKKKPKRLYKTTIKVLKSFNFPKPPSEILDDDGRLKIKIPVNFILK